MLEQLRETSNTKEQLFRECLMSMLSIMRATQLMITYFHENEIVKSDVELKQLRRFSKEVNTKLEWFIGVVKKMAGENAGILEDELNLDGEKIQNIMSATAFIALSSKDVSNEVDFMVSRTRRKEMLKTIWIKSRTTFSPKLTLDLEDFDRWFDEQFPNS